jgi:hypothetical protein
MFGTYLGNIKLLYFQVIQNVGHGFKPYKLASANILLTLKKVELKIEDERQRTRTYLNIVIDNVQQGAGMDNDAIDDLVKSSICGSI